MKDSFKASMLVCNRYVETWVAFIAAETAEQNIPQARALYKRASSRKLEEGGQVPTSHLLYQICCHMHDKSAFVFDWQRPSYMQGVVALHCFFLESCMIEWFSVRCRLSYVMRGCALRGSMAVLMSSCR